MLETSDVEHIDQLSSSIGTIVGFFCENENKTSVVKALSAYFSFSVILKRNILQSC